MNAIAQDLYRRSVLLVDQLERRQRAILLWWTMAVSFACGIRLAVGHFPSLPLDAQIASALPYVLVAAAPVASLMLALHWFRDAAAFPQPEHRLARFGAWRPVSRAEAMAASCYGVTGLMASLLLGMLINIPVRTLEFLAAIPALGATPPAWFATLFALMLADVVLLCSLYAVAFAAALRHVPLFPRLLAAIWGIDLLMQIGIARTMAAVPDLPPAVAGALHSLLEGNVKKVLISVALWTPYLLLSKRVNATFRHRLPA